MLAEGAGLVSSLWLNSRWRLRPRADLGTEARKVAGRGSNAWLGGRHHARHLDLKPRRYRDGRGSRLPIYHSSEHQVRSVDIDRRYFASEDGHRPMVQSDPVQGERLRYPPWRH